MSSQVIIVACLDEEHGIGKNNTIPWKSPQDMVWFRKLTEFFFEEGKQNAVIMGRNTWESLPRALPGRLNIVLTKNPLVFKGYTSYEKECIYYKDLAGAIAYLRKRRDIGRIYVIGGQAVYKQAIFLPEVSEMYLTTIKGKYNCDRFFPVKGALDSGFVKHHLVASDSVHKIVCYTKYSGTELLLKIENENGILINKES